MSNLMSAKEFLREVWQDHANSYPSPEMCALLHRVSAQQAWNWRHGICLPSSPVLLDAMRREPELRRRLLGE